MFVRLWSRLGLIYKSDIAGFGPALINYRRTKYTFGLGTDVTLYLGAAVVGAGAAVATCWA